MKPFKTTLLLDCIIQVLQKLQYQRRYLNPQILELKNSGYHVIVDDFGTDKPILVCLS